MPIGDSWGAGTWGDDAWGDGVWQDSGVVIPDDPIVLIGRDDALVLPIVFSADAFIPG